LVEIPNVAGAGQRRRLILSGAAAVVLLAGFVSGTVSWLKDFKRPDTRQLTAHWMMAAIPKGTRIIVEAAGPTNLTRAGYTVPDQPNRIDDEALDGELKNGLGYVLIARWSKGELPNDSRIVNAGRVAFSIDPSDERWGPFVRVIQLAK